MDESRKSLAPGEIDIIHLKWNPLENTELQEYTTTEVPEIEDVQGLKRVAPYPKA